MDRGQARTSCHSRGMVLFAGLLLCGCSILHLNRAPVPQMVVTSQPAEAAPLPEEAKPATPEPTPQQMASVEPPRPMTPVRPPPPPPVTPRPKPTEPPPPLPVPDMSTLIGADFTAILNVFRSPDMVQKNALYVVWIYSPPACTLQLFFYPDIRTTQFHLLKFDLKATVRDAPTDGPQCMQGILAPPRRGVPAP
jgi:hypothetical protein